MRTSTKLYLLLWAAAITAEVIYAVNDDTDLQGHALGAMVVVTVVFVLYRAVTRDKHQQGLPLA